MKFTLKTIILSTILALIFVSMVVQVYVIYKLSNATEFAWDKVNDSLATVKGDTALDFWNAYKAAFVGPSVVNLVAMSLLGLLIVMA